MTRTLVALLFVFSALGVAQEKGPKQFFQVTKVEGARFEPGGTIQVENSYGYLTVEGWDEPAVEVTISKSTDKFFDPDQEAKAEQHFNEILVTADRRSDKEFEISTILPGRHNLISAILPSRRIIVTMPKKTAHGVTVEYTLHVPRDSRLVIHHDHGYVWVSDVRGDIDVDSHTGDVIVILPDPGPYTVDARTRLGSVTSDLAGTGHKQLLIGTQFVHPAQGPSRRVHLRMGRGSITIKTGPPSGPLWKN